ncbi:MAG: MATE family efflux transporter [Synergistaceae bacterium]|nr:MATE family efflux transporter [Synergistaceae bacterium]
MPDPQALGQGSVGPLLLRLSLPAAVGMFVQASYTLVDAFFVGWWVGPEGIAAITMAFPLQMIIMAMAQAPGVGGASLISRSLGAGRRKRAERTVGTLFLLVLGAGLLLGAGGIRWAPLLLRLMGTSPAILPLAIDYTGALFYGAPFFAFSIAANNFVRAEGNASFAMMTMIISAGINTLLDPVFIFAFGWGIRGAALATVVSQGATALWLGWYYLAGRSVVALRWKHFRLRGRILRESLSVGAAASARQGAASLSLLVVNGSLAAAGGNYAVAAYGVVNRLLLFAVMPVFGVVQGLLPLVGFNYGAKQFCRVASAMRLSIAVSTLLCTAGGGVLFFAPEKLVGLFTSAPEVLRHGRDAARMLALGMPVVGFQVMASGLFQAIGKARPSFVLSLLRQVLLLIPLVLLLAPLRGVSGVWMAFPLADFGAALLTLGLYRKEMGRLRNFCEDAPPKPSGTA